MHEVDGVVRLFFGVMSLHGRGGRYGSASVVGCDQNSFELILMMLVLLTNDEEKYGLLIRSSLGKLIPHPIRGGPTSSTSLQPY